MAEAIDKEFLVFVAGYGYSTIFVDGPDFTLAGEVYHGEVSPSHQLALAVLKGDTGAALLLADLVQEQYTGRESELQAELKRRVDAEVKVAVKEERERCSHEATRLFDYLMLSPGLASDSAAGRAVLQVVNNIRAG